ncbi:MAG: hypothetical protein R3F43_21080 [bacterium]
MVLLHARRRQRVGPLEPDDTGGAAFVTRMRRLQADALDAEEAAVATVGSGDSFLAGATFAVSLERGVPFLGGLALASAGFDALGLGNHDFDFGPAILADFVRSTARQAEPSPDGADAGVSDAGLPAVPSLPPVTASARGAGVSLQALVDDRRLVRQHVVRSNSRRIGIVGATTDHWPTSPAPAGGGPPRRRRRAGQDRQPDRGRRGHRRAGGPPRLAPGQLSWCNSSGASTSWSRVRPTSCAPAARPARSRAIRQLPLMFRTHVPTGGGCGWWRSPVGIATSVASSSTSTPKRHIARVDPAAIRSGRGRQGRRRGAAGSLGAGERRDPLREALATLADLTRSA